MRAHSKSFPICRELLAAAVLAAACKPISLSDQAVVQEAAVTLQGFPSGPGLPSLAAPWRGPTVSLTSDGAAATFTIDGTRAPATYLSVNPQAISTDAGWTQLLYEVDLARSHGVVVIDLMVGNRSAGWLSQLESKLSGRSDVYLFLRFDLWLPALADLPEPVAMGFDGTTAPLDRSVYSVDVDGQWRMTPYASVLDEAWAEAEVAGLKRLLDAINATTLAPRVIGFRPMYLEGGEWFQPPLARSGGAWVTADEIDAKPWTSPSSYFLRDHGPQEAALFDNWLAAQGETVRGVPSTAELATPHVGTMFLSSAATDAERRAYLYQRFQAERVTWLQLRLARALKQLTDGKAAVMGIYGYLVSLAHYNGAGHQALDAMERSPDLDALSGPYSYTSYARAPGSAFVSHTLPDSLALHGKVWVHEDDSRPYWAGDAFKATATFDDDLALLTRNIATAKVHGNGLYLFDLDNLGWFGRADRPAEAAALWAQVKNLNDHFSDVGEPIVAPQIAVFVDGDSMSLQPAFGIAGTQTYGVSNELVVQMIDAVAHVGAPVRYYTVGDLETCNFGGVRFALFLNAWKLSTAQRAAIASCLLNGGRTVYFQYASGLYDEHLVPSTALMSSLLGFAVQQGSGTLVGQSAGAAGTFGAGADWSPGFYAASGSAHYVHDASRFSLVEQAFADHRVVWAAHPAVSVPLLRAWAQQAGVTLYGPPGTVVDGSGGRLLVHGPGGGALQLGAALQVDELGATGPSPVCASCSSVALDHTGIRTRLFLLRRSSTPPPAGPSLPPGLFRVGFGGYRALDATHYCGFSSGEHLRACGFTQAQYDAAPQIAWSSYPNAVDTGACVCGTPPPPPAGPVGLFKIAYATFTGGAISKDGVGYCTVPDAQTLMACGYSGQDYAAAPQVTAASVASMQNQGSCSCAATAPAGPVGLFKIQYPTFVGGAISRDGVGYCSVPDGATLIACGYSSQDYVSAPVVNVSSVTMQNRGSCSCP